MSQQTRLKPSFEIITRGMFKPRTTIHILNKMHQWALINNKKISPFAFPLEFPLSRFFKIDGKTKRSDDSLFINHRSPRFVFPLEIPLSLRFGKMTKMSHNSLLLNCGSLKYVFERDGSINHHQPCLFCASLERTVLKLSQTMFLRLSFAHC